MGKVNYHIQMELNTEENLKMIENMDLESTKQLKVKQ